MDDSSIKRVLDFGRAQIGGGVQGTSSHLDPAREKPSSHMQESEDVPAEDSTDEEDSLENRMSGLLNTIHWVLANGPLDGRLFHLFHEEASYICCRNHRDELASTKLIANAITQNFNSSYKLELDKILTDHLPAEEAMDLIIEFSQRLREISRIFMRLESHSREYNKRLAILNLTGKLIARNFLREPDSPLEQLVWKQLTYRDSNGRESSWSWWFRILEWTAPFMKRNLLTQLPERMANTYAELADIWIQDPSLYISRVDTLIRSEMSLIEKSKVPSHTKLKVMASIRWIFLFRDFNIIMEKCMYHLISLGNLQDIANIFAGAKEVDAMLALNNVKIMHHHWRTSVSREVNLHIESSQQSNEDLVTSLNGLYRLLDRLPSLGCDESFRKDVSIAFREQFNNSKHNSTILNALCRYCDLYFKSLRKKQNAEPQEPFNSFKQKVLVIFDCISNKDELLEMYKGGLGRRLLFRRGPIRPQEIEIVKEFATLIGENNTVIQSMQTMFDDVQNLIPLEHMPANCELQISMNVLDSRCWPEIPRMNTGLLLPSTMQDYLDQLVHQYKQQDRRAANQILDWTNYGLHQVELEASFGDEMKTLAVNLLQATILLQFKEGSRLTAEELCRVTHIEPSLLHRVLHGLSQEKVAVLTIQDGRYTFNDAFANKQKYIKVPFAREKDVPAKVSNEFFVERNRQDEYRSQIVRIMKGSRKLPYATLLSRTLEACQVRGPVTVQNLKQAVEHLLKTEFLQRIGKDTIEYLP